MADLQTSDIEAIPARADGGFERPLAQAEIDAITGWEPPAEPPRPDGLRGVVDGPAASRDALPMLRVVAERFVAAAGETLADLLGRGAELSLAGIRPVRCGSYLDDLPMPSHAFALRAEGWGGPALAVLGPGVMPTVLDALLGGGTGAAPHRPDDRPPTAIEAAVLRRVVAALLGDADRCFGALAPVTFAIERLAADPGDAAVAAPGDAVVVVAMRLAVAERAGTIDLVLPFATLGPVRNRLAEAFMGEASGPDDPWSGHFSTELWSARMSAEAVLHEVSLPLGRVLDLAVGDTLMFERKPSDLVEVRCGGVFLTRGRIGKVEGRIAVQVVESLPPSRPTGRTISP